jgi:rhodanese-related sulfurtransferase
MPEDLRMNADELKKRMESGEEFTIIDVRNPNAWAEATDMAVGANRVSLDEIDKLLPQLPRDQAIVAYCT